MTSPVTTTLRILLSPGVSNITSSSAFSIIDRRPRAPVPRFIAISAAALIVSTALIGYALFGDPAKMPSEPVQWLVLAWLGLVASGLGYYLWNLGATLVDAGTLAVISATWLS